MLRKLIKSSVLGLYLSFASYLALGLFSLNSFGGSSTYVSPFPDINKGPKPPIVIEIFSKNLKREFSLCADAEALFDSQRFLDNLIIDLWEEKPKPETKTSATSAEDLEMHNCIMRKYSKQLQIFKRKYKMSPFETKVCCRHFFRIVLKEFIETAHEIPQLAGLNTKFEIDKLKEVIENINKLLERQPPPAQSTEQRNKPKNPTCCVIL